MSFSRVHFIEAEIDKKARAVLGNAFPADKKVLYQRCTFFMCLPRNVRKLINERFSFCLPVKDIEEAENTVQPNVFFPYYLSIPNARDH